MSGGVDSSVAAALMLEQGHEVVGATMKLWGGPSDSGCCSVADVEDARRVCQQLGVDHHVFNFTSEFERQVVAPYVAAHGEARTPNPCIACNAHLKFDRFLQRAAQLGFDAIATGHHARVARTAGHWELRRGRDDAKDQSYVLYMLGQAELARLCLPIGELTKTDVRQLAGAHGLRTATKPDSQDVCFISRVGGRESFISERIPVRQGRLVARDGERAGDCRRSGAGDRRPAPWPRAPHPLAARAPLRPRCRPAQPHGDGGDSGRPDGRPGGGRTSCPGVPARSPPARWSRPSSARTGARCRRSGTVTTGPER